MSDIAFTTSEAMKARRAVLNDCAQDGKLTPLPDRTLPQDRPQERHRRLLVVE